MHSQNIPHLIFSFLRNLDSLFLQDALTLIPDYPLPPDASQESDSKTPELPFTIDSKLPVFNKSFVALEFEIFKDLTHYILSLDRFSR